MIELGGLPLTPRYWISTRYGSVMKSPVPCWAPNTFDLLPGAFARSPSISIENSPAVIVTGIW